MKIFQYVVSFLYLIGLPLLSEAQIQNPSSNTWLRQANSLGERIQNSAEYLELNNSALPAKSLNILSDWISLGEVTDSEVSQASLASDGTRLLVHYRRPNPSLNSDEGYIKEWTGSLWTQLASLSNQCHNPDIAVKGDIVAASWHDDSYDYGFSSNINGPFVNFIGSLLQDQWGMTVAIAHNRPYMTFACRYTDGRASTYMMLHIIGPIGPGPKVTLNGGWRVPYVSVGTDPSITGDDNAWYVVFRQEQNLYVMKGYKSGSQSIHEDIGNGFTVSGSPGDPEIVLLSGVPVVVWLEESDKKIYIATRRGGEWILIGTSTADTGYFYSLRAVTYESSLYVVFVSSEGSSRISVNKWENDNWSAITGRLESSNTANISTVDIAVHENLPVVAFVEDHVLKVMKPEVTSVKTDENIPTEFQLSQNYPNPFNPSTKIEFAIKETGYVNLGVYDILGQLVSVLLNKQLDAGYYEVEFKPQDNMSGVYFYKLDVEGKFSSTKKMILMK